MSDAMERQVLETYNAVINVANELLIMFRKTLFPE
jgi:hypothetical protein